ncbi:MAG: hypothetical protein QGG36_22170 [Pirellulaceae bacterium]|jgi:hypothetical protein|nr:hypothetical protein [Pirellulaceae bacterium]MDP7018521.1 hypothetical protein [Pirellulaceae bacterium]
MTNLDQFESAFKSADKRPFQFAPVTFDSVLVVTDLNESMAGEYQSRLAVFLQRINPAPRWNVLANDALDSVDGLLERVRTESPDLICTYRNLQLPARQHPYSLGVFVDVLTQATAVPVMLTPHAERVAADPTILPHTQTVIAITDHLLGDDRLVNHAAAFARPGGHLWLTHLEDERHFDRYIDAIGKIPAIDTDTARDELLAQLLKEPAEYIESCGRQLTAADADLVVESEVTLGSHLSDYRRLIQDHDAQLVVLNAKEEDQLAMHGMAYPLSVELRDTPLVLL